TSLYTRFIDFATENHTFFVVAIALPLSFVWDIIYAARDWYVQIFLAAPLLHNERVAEVQRQVKEWNAKGRPNKMCTARPAWQTMSTRTATFKNDCTMINVDLHDILEVDQERMIVRCEPLVNMGQLSRHLLPLGYSPAIMIEMEDLTVGGCLMGIGIETNSHIYGTLADTAVSYEVVVADGSLVKCSSTENPDLFYALPWSHGTLGFLVSVELKIIPCKSHMHMTYIPCHTLEESTERMQELTSRTNPPQFLEVTVYSRQKSVIMVGEYADVTNNEQKRKVNHVNYFWKPWFFKHAESSLYKGQFDEYLPLRHYIHRHTRSIFWELEDLIPFGNATWYRYLFGWLGAPKVSILKLVTHTPEIRKKTVYNHVVQDVMVPIKHMKEAIELFDDEFSIYPLLYYPVKFFKRPEGYSGFVRDPKNVVEGSTPPYEMYFDLGAYGIPPAVKKGKEFDAAKAVRAMEEFTRSLGGAQMLYADIFMTRDEFEE
ncbi:FAD-binding domain-containing protein, partial [Neoconidiobolus thromboides FSU 785]